MTAAEYASLEENTGKHLLDVMDGFAKLKSIGFGVWLSKNTIPSNSKDGWYSYGGKWLTVDECFDCYNLFKINNIQIEKDSNQDKNA